jgi:LAO/AO transport system kinase
MTRVTPDKLAAEVIAGSRRALAKAITLIESTRSTDRDNALRLLGELAPHAGKSVRVGISGVPGVGKSTFIEALGNLVIEQGHRVGVLAVDPTSEISGGSILGDKTRMAQLSKNPAAYIRPTPAGGTLGGVARRTREAMIVCEAAGFDVIIVETVGVGQSETAVAGMTDMFVLLLLPGGGDELQGIKRGIMELADLVLINKADGELEKTAGRSAADYGNALRLIKPRTANWTVPVETVSAETGRGIAQTWEQVQRYAQLQQSSGAFEERRAEQARNWLWQETGDGLIARLRNDPHVSERLPELEHAVAAGLTSPSAAAAELIDLFLKRGNP